MTTVLDPTHDLSTSNLGSTSSGSGSDSDSSTRLNGTADASKASGGAEDSQKPRRPRGFAAMDRKKVSEIASKGGKAAHAAGTAHQFSSDEARNAGRKGGVAPHVRRGRGPRVAGPESLPESEAKTTEEATE